MKIIFQHLFIPFIYLLRSGKDKLPPPHQWKIVLGPKQTLCIPSLYMHQWQHNYNSKSFCPACSIHLFNSDHAFIDNMSNSNCYDRINSWEFPKSGFCFQCHFNLFWENKKNIFENKISLMFLKESFRLKIGGVHVVFILTSCQSSYKNA